MYNEEKKYFLEELEVLYNERKLVFLGLGLALVLFLAFSFLSVAGEKIPFTHYFLSVGQGDSEVVIFRNGAVMLVDGGPPNGRAVREVGKILPFFKRSVDLVLVTHPEEDHFGGLIELLKRYKVGIVVTNGDENDTESYFEFTKILEEKNIKTIMVSEGDRIKQGDISFSVLWPNRVRSEKPNENALVLLGEYGEYRSLLASDIPDSVEKEIIAKVSPLALLKVPHHGSKYSSSQDFLFALNPAVAVIEVGENNYGHPSPDTLSRLASVGAQILRTDRDGTVSARFENGRVIISRIK